MRKSLIFTLLALFTLDAAQSQTVSTFESLELNPESHWDGAAATLGTYETDLIIGNATFKNSHTRADWGYGITESWSGFAFSKVTDNTTPGYMNQFSAIAGSGAEGSSNYGVMYIGMGMDKISFDTKQILSGISICNATYPFFSMKDGDAFAKQFGGEDGNDPDYFMLSVIGYNDEVVSDTVDFYLADFRFENNTEDFIINEWTNLDLTTLGNINSIQFILSSSDNGDWGMNTPAYFCVDNLGTIDFEDLTFTSGDFWNGSTAALGTYHSEFVDARSIFNNTYTLSDWGYGLSGSWSSWAYSNMTDNTSPGYGNSFSSIAGGGAIGSQTYALCYNDSGQEIIQLESVLQANSIYITNGTYPYFSMKDGDAFAKKFGGEDGNEPDFFLLKIQGYLNGQITDTIDFYLADFRFSDNTQDYIIDDWTMVDLTTLGVIDQISFSLSSSDMGDWGMNTPAYFFIDELNLSTSDGIQIFDTQITLTIYPNPATEMVTVTSDKEINQIDIISINGQTIRSITVGDSLKEKPIQISNLPKGQYLVRTQAGQSTITKRLIKN